ncbi:MAG: methylenetetrahydrofolate--tRNA-(uracil(54)-C(5))-methyltransferase (FADH(2)-oxidizing) TrmFO [Clostridia bacterium]|nr:methylenetetrahydrofolate--tRNA-(uracil(54)-C(5))-methyltransferase (FADH(2)-oxidizing) TrmFO [Clostridia bacterium]
MKKAVNIIGAGLAGCEASYQLAKRGIPVNLFEMKPLKKSEAHHSDYYSELVCSNSLKSTNQTTSSGLLKKELELLDSLILKTAYETAVPAGDALAVDREMFSRMITEKISQNKMITVIHEEVSVLDEKSINLISTGPLTSQSLLEGLQNYTGKENLYFFDAAAPIVSFDSIDMSIAYKKSRYDKGEADYINCSMNREQYDQFYHTLISSETIELKDFEKKKIYEGCMPVEVMAKRGYDTLRFGPMKPVGLDDHAYAVVQLRQDNSAGTLYNIVGFQTNLKFGEQEKLIKMIPGLKNVKVERFGVMHKNSYLNAPQLLNSFSQFKVHPDLFAAGQLSGVEGYMESTMSGLACGINISRYYNQQPMITFPQETMTGALLSYISDSFKQNFQPINSNFGILMSLEKNSYQKNEKKQAYYNRAVEVMKKTIEAYSI